MLNKEFFAYAEKLNKAQKEALFHHKGPAMILAGPGSGKTTVLTGRVRYLTEQLHIPPSSILVLTYTKAAACSMQERFIRETAGKICPVVFGTFHAVCYQILKEQYQLKHDCLLSEQEKLQIIKSLLKQYKQKADTEEAEWLLGFISIRKNSLNQKEEAGLKKDYGYRLPETKMQEGLNGEENTDKALFELMYQDYKRKCEQLGKLDFDDILLKCFLLFRERKDVLLKWQKRFPYILVDEFQDCNDLQFAVLKLLAGESANLFVVGDDDQSIYGFRGANPDIMRQFAEDYPQAAKIRLEANYRSRAEIVKASNRVIAENKKRFSKNMYAAGEAGEKINSPVQVLAFTDKKAQEEYIFSRVRQLTQKIPYKDMAVIFRTNKEAELFSYGLEEMRIPYTLKGYRKSKYAHFFAYDMAAYLKASQIVRNGNTSIPRKLALVIANKPDRGIMREWLQEESMELVSPVADAVFEKSCLQMYRQLCRIGTMSPWAAISYIRKVTGYDKWLLQKANGDRDKYEEWKRVADFIHGEAKRFERIEDWLLYAERESSKTEGPSEDKGIKLMTMHGAKGLEFSYVCIPNVNQGCIPHGKMLSQETLEEERRLFYVGMTRAKTALDILYLTGTGECPKLPSAFLNPLLQDTDRNVSARH
ncbi:MAG: ATP-dependent helicase [Lachnospiraceae bacterium]|nr:ATP-dependent helicase [Lachnospiraceae bacterium]